MSYYRKNKYHAKKVINEYGTFDSIKEFKRYLVLRGLEDAGCIKNLQRQVKFNLIPAQYELGVMITKGPNKGKLKPGKLLERACYYKADFTYYDGEKFVVEDTKGVRTDDYIIKRKLMLWLHGIAIKEV